MADSADKGRGQCPRSWERIRLLYLLLRLGPLSQAALSARRLISCRSCKTRSAESATGFMGREMHATASRMKHASRDVGGRVYNHLSFASAHGLIQLLPLRLAIRPPGCQIGGGARTGTGSGMGLDALACTAPSVPSARGLRYCSPALE
jgi:hypothetical protein